MFFYVNRGGHITYARFRHPSQDFYLWAIKKCGKIVANDHWAWTISLYTYAYINIYHSIWSIIRQIQTIYNYQPQLIIVPLILRLKDPMFKKVSKANWDKLTYFHIIFINKQKLNFVILHRMYPYCSSHFGFATVTKFTRLK